MTVTPFRDGAWTGEPVSEDEKRDMIETLQAIISDIESGHVRGFTIAAVGASGIGAEYRVSVKCKIGCSTLGLIGAAYLAAHEAATSFEASEDERQ